MVIENLFFIKDEKLRINLEEARKIELDQETKELLLNPREIFAEDGFSGDYLDGFNKEFFDDLTELSDEFDLSEDDICQYLESFLDFLDYSHDKELDNFMYEGVFNNLRRLKIFSKVIGPESDHKYAYDHLLLMVEGLEKTEDLFDFLLDTIKSVEHVVYAHTFMIIISRWKDFDYWVNLLLDKTENDPSVHFIMYDEFFGKEIRDLYKNFSKELSKRTLRRYSSIANRRHKEKYGA